MLTYIIIYQSKKDNIELILVSNKEAYKMLNYSKPNDTKILFSGEILLSEIETKYLSFYNLKKENVSPKT